MTPDQMQDICDQVKCNNFEFIVYVDGKTKGNPYLQIRCRGHCNNTGEAYTWKSRKWLLSKHMVKSEIVQTCWAAAKMATEHELREQFTYKGERIFGPHFDVEMLVQFAKARHLDVREG